MRQTTPRQRLHLLVHVILHAPDRWRGIIQQKIRSPPIAVVRKANTARIDDGHLRNAAHVTTDEYARRRPPAGPAANKPTPTPHRSLPAPAPSSDSPDWRAPAPSGHASDIRGRASQPREPLLSQRCTRRRADLTNRRPKRRRRFRLAREILQRLGPRQHLIRIADHALPAEIANAIYNLHRTRSAVGQVPSVENQIGRSLPQVRQHRLKRSEVAVDVRYDRDTHHSTC